MKLKTQNRLLLTVHCLLITAVCLFSGCQSDQKARRAVAGDPNTSQAILVGTDTFPQQMVGVWINEEHGWIMRLEEDGRLTKLRHTIGRRDLAAGQRSEFPLVGGGKGFMQPGPWAVEYNKNTNEVVVDVSLDSFEYDIAGQGVISGASRDIFIGRLPERDENIWTAQWISKPDYMASTEDKTYQDYTLPFDAGDEDKGEIVFEKYDPDAPDHDHQ